VLYFCGMHHITQETIRKAIITIDNSNDEDLEKVFKKFRDKQPNLLKYIEDAHQAYGNEQLEYLLFYYFCLICQCFDHQKLKISCVSEKDINEHHFQYIEMMEEYVEKEDEEIIDSYVDQPELTKFLLIEFSEPDDDGTTLSEDTATQLFRICLSMVALLNRCISKE